MMKQDDKADFIKAMMVELNDHEIRNHWTVFERSVLPLKAKRSLLFDLSSVSVFLMVES